MKIFEITEFSKEEGGEGGEILPENESQGDLSPAVSFESARLSLSSSMSLTDDEGQGDLSPAASFASTRLSLSSSTSSSPCFSPSPSSTPWDRRIIGRDIEVRVSFDWLPFTYEEWYGHSDPGATRAVTAESGSSSTDLAADHSASQTSSYVSSTVETQKDMKAVVKVIANHDDATIRNLLKYFLSKLGAGLAPHSIGKQDRLLSYKDIERHAFGEFSMAVVQANNLLEDASQVDIGPLSNLTSGPYGTFVGVYDGHGGPETARFITEHLFDHLKRFATEQNSMSTDVIRKAYQATEEGFFSLVRSHWQLKPQLATVGSCCLVTVICEGTLYVANVGDSRVILGRVITHDTGNILAVQLSEEHNASNESVRQELRATHPDDPQIVVLKHGVWRVKGRILHSRSIGDVYLKKAEFNREPILSKFRLCEPFKRPILSSEPSIYVHQIHPHDKFLILASDGLWECLSNQEAVDIVHNHPRSGSARRLVKAALQEVAKKRDMRYEDIKQIDRGLRRHFHDDITVIVVYLDSNVGFKASTNELPAVSFRVVG